MCEDFLPVGFHVALILNRLRNQIALRGLCEDKQVDERQTKNDDGRAQNNADKQNSRTDVKIVVHQNPLLIARWMKQSAAISLRISQHSNACRTVI